MLLHAGLVLKLRCSQDALLAAENQLPRRPSANGSVASACRSMPYAIQDNDTADLHYSMKSSINRFKFTIRTLLLCVSTLCVVFAITTWWWRAYCRQNAAVNSLWQIEALPYYECQSLIADDIIKSRPSPWHYEFCRKFEPVLDHDMFYSIGGVQFESARNTTDKDVGRLRTFSRLQWVDLAGKERITDACVEDLSAIKSLRVLYLHGTSISRKGYETLRRELPNAEIHWREPK